MCLVLRTISAERFGDMCIETGSAIGIGGSLFTSIQETKLMAGGKIPPNVTISGPDRSGVLAGIGREIAPQFAFQ